MKSCYSLERGIVGAKREVMKQGNLLTVSQIDVQFFKSVTSAVLLSFYDLFRDKNGLSAKKYESSKARGASFAISCV